MTGIGVGWIEPAVPTRFPEILRQLRPPERQQGPNDPALNRSDTAQPGRAGTGDDSHQDGLDLVIPVMGGTDEPCSDSRPGSFEPRVAPDSCERLTGGGSKSDRSALKWDLVRGSQLFYLDCHFSGRRMDSMIQMRHDEIEPVHITAADHQIEQCN